MGTRTVLSSVAIAAAIVMSCASAKDETLAKLHVQYRIITEYTPDAYAPKMHAIARALTFEKWDSQKKPRFALNGQQLIEGKRGIYTRDSIPVAGYPYVLEWTILDYIADTISIHDTINAPLTISEYASGDTVSKAQGFTLVLSGATGNTSNVTEAEGISGNVDGTQQAARLYCLITGQNSDGTPLLTDTTRIMFNQNDDGRLEISAGVLSGLAVNTHYKLFIERGRSAHNASEDVDVISNSFSEALTYFYLAE